jgi:hypothetical protein
MRRDGGGVQFFDLVEGDWRSDRDNAASAGVSRLASRPRWRNYDSTLEPLGALDLERTKTQVPRRVPVHPTLAHARRVVAGRLGAHIRAGARG